MASWFGADMPKAINDPLIYRALESGEITTDPDLGLVLREGTPAGAIQRTGYVTLTCLGRSVAAHRVIWIAAHGEVPPQLEVNHKNRIKHDNRLANLELTTPTQNRRHASVNGYWRDEDIAAIALARPEWWRRVVGAAQDPHTTAADVAELRRQVQDEHRLGVEPYALMRRPLLTVKSA